MYLYEYRYMYVFLIGFIDIGVYTNSLLPPLPLRKAMKAEGYAFISLWV